MQLIWSQKSADCGLKRLVLWVATITYFNHRFDLTWDSLSLYGIDQTSYGDRKKFTRTITLPLQISILKDALRRYEHFIGITNGEFSVSEIDSDKKKYPHLLKFTHDGQPIFVDEFAIHYIALITGLPLEQCAAIVYLDWVDNVASGLVSGDTTHLVEERYQASFG